MSEISAAQVKALRDKTGVSMGDCKKALVEAGGDTAKAIEILNKKFAGQMNVRADKEAANGRIGAYADGRVGALVELRCETDFVANNSDFKVAADTIAAIIAQSGVTDAAKALDSKGTDGRSVREVMSAAFGKLKENMNLAQVVRIDHAVACYVHHNGKVGTIVAADKAADQTAKHICMHIAAQPVLWSLNREGVHAAEVEKARLMMKEQIKDKPANILDKIVSGKMDKWFGERVLLEQPFAMDDKKTVGQVAKEAGMTLRGYLRMDLGVKIT